MISMKRLAGGAALTVLALAASSAVYAQETTSAIRGQVTDNGVPVAGATVTVTHKPTGTVATTLTGPDGVYLARGLRVGGPYAIAVVAPGQAPMTVEIASVGVGDPVGVDVEVNPQSVSEVLVTAGGADKTKNNGPTTRFTRADLDALPSLKRDLKDAARLNPFITLDPTNLDAVIAAGTSSKYNSLTIDGVKQNDDFGLNNNGYPTQRGPISTDAVQALSVNLAPFSVIYNDFQGANLNAVTKSGTNEFHGTVFGEDSNDKYIGDKSKTNATGLKTYTNKFSEKSYGATLGGPIWKDKLFFFLSYENYEAERPVTAGPVGSGRSIVVGDGVTYVTSAQLTQVQDILATKYGYDFEKANSVLNISSLPEEDVKKLAKIDWNITDKHRLAFTYQDTDGTRQIEGNRSSATQLQMYGGYYTKGDHLRVYTGQLNSQWTDALRTEVVFSQKEVTTIQQPLGGCAGDGSESGDEACEFGQFAIGAIPGVSGTNTRILAGPDISRHANSLSNTVKTYRGRAFYELGEHSFIVGAEREDISVFNLFAQNTEGAFTYNSIADLQAGTLQALTYQGAITDANGDGVRNEKDLAAAFDFKSTNLYFEDSLRITPDLTVGVGFRYQYYTQNDKPLANANFLNRYKFTNSENLDGRSIVLPRVSFNWTPEFDAMHVSRVNLNGGFGLFSGGSSTVWLSNSYSNTGVLGATVSCTRGSTSTSCGTAGGTTDTAILNQVTSGYDIPSVVESLLDPTKASIVAIQRAANVNALDPNFKPISTWKTTLSFSADLDFGPLGDGYRFTADGIYSDVNNAILWKDYRAGLAPIAFAPDGRPIYNRAAERGALVAGSGTDTGADYVLTNTKKGYQKSAAIGLAKSFPFGIDASASATWVRAKDVNSGTSSTASSNFGQVATYDLNNPALATSNYEVKYSYKGRLSWKHAFFGDNNTGFNMFFERRAGLPFSYTFLTSGTATATNSNINNFGDAASSRQLFYVPKADSSGNVTATSDSLVNYGTGFDIVAFNDFLKSSGLMKYNGKISPRNAFKSRDVSRIDLRFTQELPAFFPNAAKLQAYVDLINFGNMINKKYGVVEQVDFPYTSVVVSPQISNGKYIYSGSNFKTSPYTAANSDAPNRSLWQVKFGLKYTF
jgi:hypothetical protein